MTAESLAAASYASIAEDAHQPEPLRRAAKLQAKAEQLQHEDSADALEPATEALQLFREVGAKGAEGVADALLVMIASMVASGRCDEAQGLAESELQSFEAAEDRAGAAKMRLALGQCRGKGDDVLPDAEDAREDFQELDLPRHEAAACLLVARVQLAAGNTEEALEAAETAQQLSESLGDVKGEALAVHTLAMAKFRLQDFSGAMAAGQRACSLSQTAGLKKLEAQARSSLADAVLRYRPAGEEGKQFVNEAMDLAEAALPAFDRLADDTGKILATDQRVRALLARGESLQAQEVAQQALEQARSQTSQASEAAALQALLAVHLAKKALDDAAQCAQDAASVLEALGDRLGEAGAWHVAAQLHLRKEKPNAAEALRCAEAARKAHRDQGSVVSADEEATVLQTLSAAHLANGNASKALEVAGVGRDLCKQASATGSEALCTVRAASAYIQLGDLEAALSAASDAQELFREVGDQRAEASAAHLVARLQLQRQDYSAARLAADTARALLRQTTELGREAGMLLLSSQAGSLELAAGAEPGGGKAARSFFEGRGRNKVLTTSKEAVAMTKRLSSDHMVLLSRLAEARAKVSNGLLDEAAEDLQEVQPVLQQLGDHRAAGAAKLLQANISILRGAPDVTAAQEALECFRTANSTHEVALAQALIAKLSRVASQVPKPVVSLAKTSQPESTAAAAAVAPKPAAIDKMSLALPERVKYTLTELVAEAIGQEGMEEDRTLMETGMTSIASIMLRDKIQAEFPEIPEMDLTFVFDYPTIREMTGFVLTQLPSDA